MVETPNHGYNVPDPGTEDWHTPLNANFEAFDVDIELRDAGDPSSNGYSPAAGAKYFDTANGVIYLGDGSSWTEAFRLDDGSRFIEELRGGAGISPFNINSGDSLSVNWSNAADLLASGAIDLDSIAGDNIAVDGTDDELDAPAPRWEDADTDDLLEPTGSASGIEVVDVRTDTLADNGSGDLTAGSTLDMGGNDIVNVGSIAGGAHASTHVPSGSDPLPTDTPVPIGSTIAEGTADAFARADHVHAHGDQPGGSLHDLATTSTAGFMAATDKQTLADLDTTYVNQAGDTMTGLLDLGGNDLVDGGATIWDSTNGFVPLSALERDSLTVTAGSGLSGGGTMALGGSTTIDLDIPYAYDGGGFNTAIGPGSTVAGGEDNTAEFEGATIGGGLFNSTFGIAPTVSGGEDNTADFDYATVGGGFRNTAAGIMSTIGGGDSNEAPGDAATVPGGLANRASGSFSFAAGRAAKTETSGGTVHDGAFVWSDGTNTTTRSTAGNEVRFQANGGFAIQDGNLAIEGSNSIEDASGNAHLTINDAGNLGVGRRLDLNANDLVNANEVRASTVNTGTVTDDSSGDLTIEKATALDGAVDSKAIRIDATESDSSDTADIVLSPGAVNGNLVAENLRTGTGTALVLDASGNVLLETSSARFKRDVRPLSTPTEPVLDLQPRTYRREEGRRRVVGLVAEEVDETLPELVNYDEEDRPFSVRYDRLGVYLVPEVRTNRERLDALEDRRADRVADLEAQLEAKDERIEELEAEVDALDRRLETLEARVETGAQA